LYGVTGKFLPVDNKQDHTLTMMHTAHSEPIRQMSAAAICAELTVNEESVN